MKTQAWPFLISRNQSVDYKTVVAPDFISQAKIRSLLLKVTEDDLAEDGEASVRWIQGSEVGNFTVVFRVAKARKRDIGESENDVLRDLVGREIYLIEGLVFEETPYELQDKIRQVHFNITHRELKDKFQTFWYDSKISDSSAIYISRDASSPIIKLKELEPLSVSAKRQLPVIVESKTRNSKYPRTNKIKLSSLLVFGFVLFFFITTFWIFFGGDKTISQQQLEKIKNCFYVTSSESISFNNNSDGSKPLEDFKKKYPEAWIFLEGSLNVKLSDEVKQLVKKAKSQNKGNQELTVTLSDDKKLDKLSMKYHPLDATISLLQKQSVTSGKLDARVIKLVQAKSASQCSSKIVLDSVRR